MVREYGEGETIVKITNTKGFEKKDLWKPNTIQVTKIHAYIKRSLIEL